MTDYKWKPIEPLGNQDRNTDLGGISHLYDSWHAVKSQISQSSPAELDEFTAKLVRSLSIETGIVEHLYDLDRGTTEALIAHGFVEELVTRSSTDIEPSRLIDILRDQEAAIQLVMDCITENRELTKGVLHELHTTLMRHQETTHAADQFGKRSEIDLVKGQFKKLPNNPKRPDGSIHEYCPLVQVESEVENLLTWYASYESEDPIVVGAWLHHRFAQIHPYQDGNGRVARTLTTLVLLKADLLPLVIDRDLRSDYIKALEKADEGDLSPLAVLFARLERRAILQALSVDVDADISRERSITGAVIESIGAKLSNRRRAKDEQLRKVNDLAMSLRARTRNLLEEQLAPLSKTVEQIGEPNTHISDGGPDRGNAHWYKFDVIESGKSSGKYVNFAENHYFIKASIRVEASRLIFLTSLHHVGRELTGIMEVTAFAQLQSFEDPEEREVVSKEFFPCSLDPFVITWKTSEEDIGQSYDTWLDRALAIAVKEWGDRL